MRTFRTFVALVGIAFVAVSALSYPAAKTHTTRGTIGDFEEGQWIVLSRGRAHDAHLFRLSLRETTAYEGNPSHIRAGVRVQVWYKNVGERRLVVDRVRVLGS